MNTHTVPYLVKNSITVSFQRENEFHQLAHLPIWIHNGDYFIEGIPGRRYTIDVENTRLIGRREFVVSVDGIDIHDGEDASETKSGLVVGASQHWSFEGFRTSTEKVAVFRFSTPGDSYASLTGRPKNIGVIGIAAYNEKVEYPKPNFAPRVPKNPIHHYDFEKSSSNIMYNLNATSRELSHSPMRSSQSIGTEYGEEHYSAVGSTTFIRENLFANTKIVIRYETAAVLERMGIPIHASSYVAPSMEPNPFPATPQKFVPPPPTRVRT